MSSFDDDDFDDEVRTITYCPVYDEEYILPNYEWECPFCGTELIIL